VTSRCLLGWVRPSLGGASCFGLSSFGVLAALGATACHASVDASASMNTTKSEDVVDFDKRPGGTDGVDAIADSAASQASAAEPALLGARQDVELVPGAPATECRCVQAAVGMPSSPLFKWQGEVPGLDPASQLVVAFRTSDLKCQGAPEGSLGASYWGYRQTDKDVIVVLEAAQFGRPMTSGAIIPRPAAGGRLFLEPRTAKIPFGAAASGNERRCLLPGS
jgi:hypothetical protein